jgi:hypothetical protein
MGRFFMNENNDNDFSKPSAKLEASRRQLDAARCNEQVSRSVALNRLDVTHDILTKAACADGLTADQLQLVLSSLEYSMLLLESSGRVRSWVTIDA